MERLRQERPKSIILLTFFSPSGYEIRKNYSEANGVFYLPLDTSSASSDFLDIVKPIVACFVKYEYWPNYFLGCQRRGVPLIMISAILRPNQRFFGWSRFFLKPVLDSVSHYFVQDEGTRKLLNGIGIERVTLAGDTRFDRVSEIVAAAAEIQEIREWAQNAQVLIGGSTWPADEKVLHAWWQMSTNEWKLLLVPHEIEAGHIQSMQRLWPEATLWSQRAAEEWKSSRVVIVDEIGKLSAMYRYATIAWIGGGFGAGIHNTLEAAAWSLPVFFGPRFEKFAEAGGLIDSGAAIGAHDEEEAVRLLSRFASDSTEIPTMGMAAGAFAEARRGATDKIMSFLRSS